MAPAYICVPLGLWSAPLLATPQQSLTQAYTMALVSHLFFMSTPFETDFIPISLVCKIVSASTAHVFISLMQKARGVAEAHLAWALDLDLTMMSLLLTQMPISLWSSE